MQSIAFTHGSDVYFSAGSYRPGDAEGQRLLAHELAHVAQPHGSAASTAIIGRADDPAEAAADRAAVGVVDALRRQASFLVDQRAQPPARQAPPEEQLRRRVAARTPFLFVAGPVAAAEH